MKVALDAAAGDLGLAPNIEGAIPAVHARGVELLLVGPAARTQAALRARAVANALRTAKALIGGEVNEKIRRSVEGTGLQVDATGSSPLTS